MAVIQLECCVTVIQCVKTVWFCTSQRDNWERERERQTDRQTDRQRQSERDSQEHLRKIRFADLGRRCGMSNTASVSQIIASSLAVIF